MGCMEQGFALLYHADRSGFVDFEANLGCIYVDYCLRLFLMYDRLFFGPGIRKI